MDHLVQAVGLDNVLVGALTVALLVAGAVLVALRPHAFWRWWEGLVGQQTRQPRNNTTNPKLTPEEKKRAHKKDKKRDKERRRAHL